MASDEEAREPAAPRRAWQGADADAGATGGTRQRSRAIILTGALSALVTTVVVLLLFFSPPPPPPHFLAINVAEHNDKHFPIQAFARADTELLMRHFDADSKRQATTKSKEGLRTEFNALKDRSTKSLVLHVTALALVRDGTVYLLPGDAEPDNQETWLDVRELLQAVEKCPAPHKLLILDLAHALVDPRLGVLTDRVAETLEAILGKEEPSYLVLCPCSAGQSSLTSEVLRSSVLAYYLDQGLVGDADTDKNGSVSAVELFEYVKPRVDRWARNNRGVHQEPRLFGKRSDFVVVPMGRATLEKAAPAAPDPYPEALLEAWKKRDEASSRGAFARTPRLLLRLEANLLRHESRWQGGAADKDLLDQETRKLIKELEPPPATPTQAPRHFSLAGAKEKAALTESFYTVLRRSAGGEKAVKELVKILQDEKEADYAQQARAVVEALSRLPDFKQDHLKNAQAALASLKGNEPYVEVLYVDRLARFASSEFPETYQRAQVETIWRTMRDREAALAALEDGPEFLPWVAPVIESADKKRRLAEAKLLWERPPAWPEALADLKAVRSTYDDVKKTLEGLQTGQTALGRAFAELPPHLRALGEGTDADPQAEQIWLKAADEAAFLQTFFLTAADPGKVVVARIDTHGRDLQQHLDELTRLFRKRVKRAERADAGKTQTQLRGLLQSPLFKAQERADLMTQLRASAKKLHDGTDASDEPASIARDKNAGLVRAEMSLALLRLVGVEPDPGEQDNLSARELTLHRLWGKEGIVKLWREALNDRRGDALSRLVSPWDAQTKVEEPGPSWQSKARVQQIYWLQAQYEAEGRETGPRDRKIDDPRDQEARDFYREAARKLPAGPLD